MSIFLTCHFSPFLETPRNLELLGNFSLPCHLFFGVLWINILGAKVLVHKKGPKEEYKQMEQVVKIKGAIVKQMHTRYNTPNKKYFRTTKELNLDV